MALKKLAASQSISNLESIDTSVVQCCSSLSYVEVVFPESVAQLSSWS